MYFCKIIFRGQAGKAQARGLFCNTDSANLLVARLFVTCQLY